MRVSAKLSWVLQKFCLRLSLVWQFFFFFILLYFLFFFYVGWGTGADQNYWYEMEKPQISNVASFIMKWIEPVYIYVASHLLMGI